MYYIINVHLQKAHSNYCKYCQMEVFSQKCCRNFERFAENTPGIAAKLTLSQYTVNFLRCQKFWLILVNAVSHCARCIISRPPPPLSRLPGLWFPPHGDGDGDVDGDGDGDGDGDQPLSELPGLWFSPHCVALLLDWLLMHLSLPSSV